MDSSDSNGGDLIGAAVQQALRTSLSADSIRAIAVAVGRKCRPAIDAKSATAIADSVLANEDRSKCNGELISSAFNNAEDIASAALKAIGVGVRYNKRRAALELKMGGKWVCMEDGEDAVTYFDVKRRVWHFPTMLPDGKLKFGKRADIKRGEWLLALVSLAHQNQYDQFEEYLKGLPKWDGKKRVENLLPAVFTCAGDPELAKFAVKSIMLGAVKRTYEPGAKHDLVVILVGKQGIGKSTFVRELLPDPELYGEGLNFAADDGRKVEALLGNVIVESSELRGTTRADVDAMKAFITRQVDEHRLAYRRNKSRIGRQAIIVGTSNEQSCLPNDPTGNRRFLPIPIDGDLAPSGRIKAGMAKQRDQLWAEALHMYNAGEISYLTPAQAALQSDQNSGFRQANVFIEEQVFNYIDSHTAPFTMMEIAGHLEITNPTPAIQREITTALRNYGLKSERRGGGSRGDKRRVWVRPD